MIPEPSRQRSRPLGLSDQGKPTQYVLFPWGGVKHCLAAYSSAYMVAGMLERFIKGLNSIVNRLALAIVIIIFCGIFIFPLFHNNENSKAVKKELQQIGIALGKYYQENNKWPSSGGRSVAEALSGDGKAKAFYKHERLDPEGRFIDPWEKPYRYFFSNDGCAVQSAGPDEKFADGMSVGGDDYWYAPR